MKSKQLLFALVYVDSNFDKVRFYPARGFLFRFVFPRVETTSFPPFFLSMKNVSPSVVAERFVPRAFAGASRLEIALQKITGGFLAHLNAGIFDGAQPSVR